MELFFMFGVGWLVAYFFFRREKHTEGKLSSKLTYDARRFLLNDPRERLGLTDVIDLFREKIIDEHLDLLDEPFPYRRCPRCGSKKIKRFVFRPDGSLDTQNAPVGPPLAREDFKLLCRSCGYHDEVALTFSPTDENP